MCVHVCGTHAARFIRFVAHCADERTFIGVHSRVNRQFAGLAKGFAAKLADVSFAFGLENMMAECFLGEELFV